jgi:hypothetical protein
MDPKFQTSFIPKKAMAETTYRSGISLFMLLSIIIFLVTLGIAGYVYLEKQSLVKNILYEQDLIKQNKGSFNSGTIENIVTLDSRINTATVLLHNHIAVTPIFDLLSKRTLKNVRFKDFTFTNNLKSQSGTSGLGISMSGTALSWETLASQADEFGKQDLKYIIQEPKVSSFSLNSDGSVSFIFSALIDPSFLSYKTKFNAQ